MVRAALVYQGGIANVFDLRSPRDDTPELAPFTGDPARERRLLYQGAFETAVAYARGLKAAGVEVLTFGCNRAGDVTGADWTADLSDLPFADRLVRV